MLKAPRATVLVAALASIFCPALAQLPFPSFAPVPPVLIPATGDRWQVGDLRTVEWGTTNVSLTNSSGVPLRGIILLSYDAGNVLNPVVLGHQPLAQNFTISQKMVNIYVPEVPTRNDYRITPAPNSLVVSSAPPISVTTVLPTSTSDGGSSTRTSTTSSPLTSSQGSASISVSVTQTSTLANGACPLPSRDMTGVLLMLLFTVVLAQAPV
ncbi:hypothetical protein V8D89_009250 [Ganoderma adspersum]